MTLICNICKLPLTSTLSNETEAIQDLLSLLKSHVKFKHKIENKEYDEHLTELLTSFKNIPSFLFLSYFVDLEHEKTTDRVGVVMEELGESLLPIQELFEEEMEEEIEDDTNVANIEEVSGTSDTDVISGSE